jgi:phosphoglucosamine mutase
MLIDELGFEVIRTRVGDAFVSDELRRRAARDIEGEFGGESSGCFIFPRVSLCPDAIYAAAKIVQIASEHRISALVDQIPSYPILRGAVPGDKATMDEVENSLKRQVESGGRLETTDGLRLAFGDGWLLIRPSGTEPKIRITAEATSEKRAEELYNLGLKTIEECLVRGERATT